MCYSAFMSSPDDDHATHRYILKNGLELIVRPAVPDDAKRVISYVEQIAGESENITIGPGEFDFGLEEERAFLQECKDSVAGLLYVVAEIDAEIVGTLSFAAGKRPRTQHAGEFGTSVLRRYWNQGIGSYLLAYLIDWARHTGIIRKINLRVRIDNLAAIHVYEKHGFVREGRLSRELYLHQEFVDAYLMGLQLDPESPPPQS
jgi:RimJ/RimL family protein N-acetyltransferase